MSVFAFSVAGGALHVFPDAAAAAIACRGEEVAADVWLFFDADGSPLRADFLERGGRYYLRPWASCASCSLPQVLHLVTEVIGPSGMDSVEAITRRLAQLAVGGR